ncbi:flagellar basal body-associated protein FliL [Enterobacteriaceae bacterium YMB-R22]|uniref:flagellar basal body-associated protein FliL n=1 Tax=Tenebrionicola larvae TaxID=2815733 RepID=UPI00201307F3|nr:flagellar basal body-associated protein FliL [Tenebrionicola larvae]MBV4414002.1 flagellar basal body-associated protein FliL [Tenebrionicola larvae]
MPKKNSAGAKKKVPFGAILLALIAVGACAIAGYTWYELKHVKTQIAGGEEVKPEVVNQPPVYMPLETFTVSLKPTDEDADRVLYIGLTLRLKDEESRELLAEFLPEIRSRLLVLLSQQTADNLATDAGKTSLVGQIKEVLNKPIDNRSAAVADVLYNAFILR